MFLDDVKAAQSETVEAEARLHRLIAEGGRKRAVWQAQNEVVTAQNNEDRAAKRAAHYEAEHKDALNQMRRETQAMRVAVRHHTQPRKRLAAPRRAGGPSGRPRARRARATAAARGPDDSGPSDRPPRGRLQSVGPGLEAGS